MRLRGSRDEELKSGDARQRRAERLDVRAEVGLHSSRPDPRRATSSKPRSGRHEHGEERPPPGEQEHRREKRMRSGADERRDIVNGPAEQASIHDTAPIRSWQTSRRRVLPPANPTTGPSPLWNPSPQSHPCTRGSHVRMRGGTATARTSAADMVPDPHEGATPRSAFKPAGVPVPSELFPRMETLTDAAVFGAGQTGRHGRTDGADIEEQSRLLGEHRRGASGADMKISDSAPLHDALIVRRGTPDPPSGRESPRRARRRRPQL